MKSNYQSNRCGPYYNYGGRMSFFPFFFLMIFFIFIVRTGFPFWIIMFAVFFPIMFSGSKSSRRRRRRYPYNYESEEYKGNTLQKETIDYGYTQSRFCSNCGNEHNKVANFCANCGFDLKE